MRKLLFPYYGFICLIFMIFRREEILLSKIIPYHHSIYHQSTRGHLVGLLGKVSSRHRGIFTPFNFGSNRMNGAGIGMVFIVCCFLIGFVCVMCNICKWHSFQMGLTYRVSACHSTTSEKSVYGARRAP